MSEEKKIIHVTLFQLNRKNLTVHYVGENLEIRPMTESEIRAFRKQDAVRQEIKRRRKQKHRSRKNG